MKSITEAIVSYAVSAKADGSAWVKLATEISELFYIHQHQEVVLKNIIKEQEEQYKKEFNESQLPPAYRSAKSVALKALTNGVSLRNGLGDVYGKTAVEKAIKDKLSVDKEDVPKNTLLQDWHVWQDKWYSSTDNADRNYIIGCMKGIIEAYEA